MKRVVLLSAVLVAGGLVGGCLSTCNHESGKPLDSESISRIEKWRTTSIEIIQWFGTTDMVTDSDDNELYVYKYCKWGGSSMKEECGELTVVIANQSGVRADYSFQERFKT